MTTRLRENGINITVTDVARGTLHGHADGVRLSFLEYRYPEIQEPILWPEFGCLVAAPEDLAAMKLSAIGSRGAKKDFVDLFALGKETFQLDRMLDLYRRKFGTDDIAHLLVSLTYFDDADAEANLDMIWEIGWDEVKKSVETWVKGYVQDRDPTG